MFKKILICSDGSVNALAAAHAAVEIAQKFDSEIVVLTVFNPAAVPAAFVGVPGADLETATDMGSFVNEVERDIERTTGKIFEEARLCYRCRRELGHPVERIIAAAQDEQADLIVMGRRGLSSFQSYLLGSVSDGVLHHAHCPVLVVH